MRLPSPLRQIVLGIDDAGRFSLRSWMSNEWVAPLRRRAQIECAEITGLPAPTFLSLLERFFAPADSGGHKLLDHERERELRIRRHSFDDGREPVRVVMRAGDTLQCVAMGARANRRFLLFRAWKAREPF